MRGGLSLHLLHGAPVLAGRLPGAAAREALAAAGAEVLTLPADGAYEGLEWLQGPPPAAVESLGASPLVMIYLKDYSESEMAAAVGVAGGGGFHAGWTLSAFVCAYAPLCDAQRLLATPAAAWLREAGALSAEAVAALEKQLPQPPHG